MIGRPVACILLICGLATCVDGPTTGSANRSRGVLAVVPEFTRDAARTASALADFGIAFDRVRALVIRPVADTVARTEISFHPGQADVPLDLPVQVRTDGEVFTVVLQFRDATSLLFEGSARVASRPTSDPSTGSATVHVDYVGPGATVTRIAIGAHPASVPTTGPLALSVQAFDAEGNVVTGVPIDWSTSDPTLAAATTPGVTTSVLPTGKRGVVTVTARTPRDVSDQTNISLIPPAASIALVSGGGQTGEVGTPLPAPALVEVRAADGLPVPGATVTFTPPPGGKVGSPSTVGDANGRVSTSLNLGTTAGPQSFTASLSGGGSSIGIPETATAGAAAAIVAVSGGGQSDNPGKTLVAQLVAVVTDQFSNPVNARTVNWSRTGTGTLGASTSTTGADGLAKVSYTLGSVVGSETITASVTGVATPATFTVAAQSALPAAIAVVSGLGQSATVNAFTTNALVVKVTDAGGFPAAGALVSWAASNGAPGAATTTADATGQTSTTLRVGTLAGAASVTASITVGATTKTVNFAVTVVAGPAVALQFATQPSNVVVAFAITPSVQVRLLDTYGNGASGTDAVSMTIGNGTAGAVLSGILTKSAVAGTATFTDLSVDRAGEGYRLTATAPTLGNVVSAPFSVTLPNTPRILLNVGASPAASTSAGQNIAIPILVDLSNRGSDNLAAISVKIAWDPGRFDYFSEAEDDSWHDVGGLSGKPLQINVDSERGIVQLAGFTPNETFNSFTLATITLKARATSTPVTTQVGATVTGAGNAAGSPIVVTPRALTVTISP